MLNTKVVGGSYFRVLQESVPNRNKHATFWMWGQMSFASNNSKTCSQYSRLFLWPPNPAGLCSRQEASTGYQWRHFGRAAICWTSLGEVSWPSGKARELSWSGRLFQKASKCRKTWNLVLSLFCIAGGDAIYHFRLPGPEVHIFHNLLNQTELP